MPRIVVLGSGAVGRHMAIDLSKQPGLEVVAVDADRGVVERLAAANDLEGRVADLSAEDGVAGAVEGADLVIGALPYSLGFRTLRAVIEAGKDVVDISYFPEDPFDLDELARARGVTAVVDCGIAPGLANIILGDHTRTMKVDRYECYVGGIPKARGAPLGYKSPFPVLEVLEEYMEEARTVERGTVTSRPMLSEGPEVEFEGVGTLGCLDSDGLRTLLVTMDIPEMLEKTLRYPEHVEAMRVLRDAGLLHGDPVTLRGTSFRPIEMTAALLEEPWRYEPGEPDVTVMRLVISGRESGLPVAFTHELYDEMDPNSGTPSMARTSGYTATAVASLVAGGAYDRTGISPPEFLGQAGCLDPVEEYLAERGVTWASHQTGSPGSEPRGQ